MEKRIPLLKVYEIQISLEYGKRVGAANSKGDGLGENGLRRVTNLPMSTIP